MHKSVIALALAALASPALGHGPQIQVTNDNNKIVTRNVMLDPYNTAPAPPTSATSVYVMPLAPISTFGGTAWFVQPDSAFPVTDPGIAWGYGWSYTDATTYTMTFPAGANFRQTFVGGLGQWDGAAFVAAAHGAQMAGYRSSGPKALSGSATTSFNYAVLAAPAAANPDPHGTAFFQLTGNGIIPDISNPPAAVDNGIYLSQMKLSLVNQPASLDSHVPAYDPNNPIQDSDSFYFVTYKGVSQLDAIAAAQAAFPGAAIQVVPEPSAFLCVLAIVPFLRRRRA